MNDKTTLISISLEMMLPLNDPPTKTYYGADYEAVTLSDSEGSVGTTMTIIHCNILILETDSSLRYARSE